MPLLAAVAVLLCTAMVLIVWSVMGGFLNMLLASGRTLMGDVAVVGPTQGFAHYEDLVARLEADPMVAGAAPMIEAFGLIHLPDGRTDTVMVKGIEGPSFDRVTSYNETLWWKPLDEPLPKDRERQDLRLREDYAERLGMFRDAGRLLTLAEPIGAEPAEQTETAAAVVGIEVSKFNARRPGGWIHPGRFLPGDRVTLTLLALDKHGRPVEPEARTLPVANEFRTGLFEIDANTVLVRLDALQSMLKMGAARRLAEEDAGRGLDPFEAAAAAERARRLEPARVTNVLVRARDGIPAAVLRERVEEIYAGFAADHEDVLAFVPIVTWEEAHRTLISAVKKETALVLFIFGIISLTAVFLVLAIFWAMVSEKTKDIGILRSIGASRAGVAWLWVRYGLAIGLVGSALGGLTAWVIITNINPIHDWLGSALGLYVWDPAVYYFTTIPSEVEPGKAAIVLFGGVLASVAGSLVPALKAAYMDPVKALRFE